MTAVVVLQMHDPGAEKAAGEAPLVFFAKSRNDCAQDAGGVLVSRWVSACESVNDDGVWSVSLLLRQPLDLLHLAQHQGSSRCWSANQAICIKAVETHHMYEYKRKLDHHHFCMCCSKCDIQEESYLEILAFVIVLVSVTSSPRKKGTYHI